MVSGFLSGFSTYFEGIRFWLQTKKLLKISIIPFFIDLVILTGGLIFSFSKIPEAVNHIVKKPEIWYQFVNYYFLVVITAMAFFLITVFVVAAIANLVAFPFNDVLCEKSLVLRNAIPDKPRSLAGYISKSFRNTAAMFKKTVIFLIVGGILILATLIPGLGIIGAFFTVFILSYDVLDYSFDHFGLSFKERRAFIKSNKSCFIGFSMGMGLTMAIPIINILAMPGSIVAGACLVAKLRSHPIEGSHT